jgi:predicted amidohydrolase YtcJ
LFGSPAHWLDNGVIDRQGLPHHMRLGGIKLFASGVWENILYYSQDELNGLMERAHSLGLTVAVHVSSDRGTEMAITAAEHTRRRWAGGDAAIRIEHLFWATDSDIQRLAATGAGVVTQPAIMWRFGAGRGRAAAPGSQPVHRYPLASLRAAGVNVGLSSDAPCFPMEPLTGIAAAVSRLTRSGDRVEPEQAVSAEEAIREYTLGAAWSDRTQDIEGSLTPGKLANFVVLSEDPTAVASDRIRDIRVEQTWVDGALAYERTA